MLNFSKNKYFATAVIVAAGNSTRMKSKTAKQLMEINNVPLIAYTLSAFEECRLIDEIVVVAREQDFLIISDIAKAFGIKKLTNIIKGGVTRTDSVKNGILASKNQYVAIHDGARPCIKTKHIELTVETAYKTGAAALGFPVADTLKMVDDEGIITKTVSREGIWAIQTPQVFEKELLLKAYNEGNTKGATDDCMLLEALGKKVTMVKGDSSNIKVTLMEDIALAEAVLKEKRL